MGEDLKNELGGNWRAEERKLSHRYDPPDGSRGVA